MADKYHPEDVPYQTVRQKSDEESSRQKEGPLKRRDFIVSAVGVAALASTAAFAQGASGPLQERSEASTAGWSDSKFIRSGEIAVRDAWRARSRC